MEYKETQTYTVDIYMAGDIAQAKQICREYCYAVGFCVHVIEADYIYTGGQEAGFKIGCVNYPRFPSEPEELETKAVQLAHTLIDRLCQHSALLVSPTRTLWITRRKV